MLLYVLVCTIWRFFDLEIYWNELNLIKILHKMVTAWNEHQAKERLGVVKNNQEKSNLILIITLNKLYLDNDVKNLFE